MHNIIKALNYQIKRDNFLIYAILAGLASIAISFTFDSGIFSRYTGSYFFGYCGGNFFGAVSFISILLSTRICGWDYADKTLNYEILSGHSRNEVYWSRVIVCLGWSMAVCVGVMLVPFIVCIAFNGWGVSMDFGGAVIRFLMLLFPTFRTICETMLFTFITKSCFTGMALSFIYVENTSVTTSMIEVFSTYEFSWEFPFTMFMDLTYMNSKMDYIDGKDVEVFITAMEPSLVTSTVLSSLGFGIGCILLGYIIFKKSDMR